GPMLGLNLNVPIPHDNAATPKQAKRRSLLPQFARKFSGDQVPKEDDIAEDEAAKADSVASGVRIAEQAERRTGVEDADSKAMPPPSKLSRPLSVFGGGGLGRAPSTRSHARNASRRVDARADALAALTGTAPPTPPPRDTGLKRNSSTRLPQSPAIRGLARTASVKPNDPPTPTSSTAKMASSIPGKRASVARARPSSVDSAAKVRPPSVVAPGSPASSTTTRQSGSRPQSIFLAPQSRPSFSTYQQHYSPAKMALPKPPIPSARHSKPTVMAEDVAPSFEVAKQQAELLSLSLLHESSMRTAQEYDASARRKLGKKQARLRKEYEALREIEEHQHRTASLAALEAWCPDTALLAENLQTASRVYTELAALSEDAGRYAQLAALFESWIDGAKASSAQSDGPGFVEALPQDWHKAHTSLALRLRALQRDLGLLPPAPIGGTAQASGLHVLLETCDSLLAGMLKELELMSKLERGVLQQEKERVDDEVTRLILGSATRGTAEQWVPAWQSVA
ncbi:hypothetical protein LTR53_006248, partial [Teratosphaeriaceae sp. CCFEE 6253]